jgi:hypothetical protein
MGKHNLKVIEPDQEAQAAGKLFHASRTNYAEALKAAHECGSILQKKKEELKSVYGAWTLWLRDNEEVLGFGERQARRLIKFSEQPFPENLDPVSILQINRQLHGHTERTPASGGTTETIEENDDEIPELTPKEAKIEQSNLRSVLLMNSAASVQCAAVYEGPIDTEIIKACRRAARAWDELANNLERKSSHG